MQQVTELDLDKVRKYVLMMNEPQGGPTDQTPNPYGVRSTAHDEAKPAADFLIKYHYTNIDPDDGKISEAAIGEKPYGTTKTERMLIQFEDDGKRFLERYPSFFEITIDHYESNAKQRLDKALEMTLSEMTGTQLLLVLNEYSRQLKSGSPLVL